MVARTGTQAVEAERTAAAASARIEHQFQILTVAEGLCDQDFRIRGIRKNRSPIYAVGRRRDEGIAEIPGAEQSRLDRPHVREAGGLRVVRNAVVVDPSAILVHGVQRGLGEFVVAELTPANRHRGIREQQPRTIVARVDGVEEGQRAGREAQARTP